LQPWLRGFRKRWFSKAAALPEPYRTVHPFTQVHRVRQQNLVELAGRIEAEKIPGCVMECGVLDGGTAALMAWATNRSNPVRPVHLFDSWEGLPPASPEDGAEAAKWGRDVVGSPRRVRQILERLGVPMERVHFHRGWFDATFPTVDPGAVALLHIDADFYDSVKLCFARWYSALAPGGFIQIDDYDAFSGCQKATDEFLALQPELKLEHVGTAAKAYFLRKPGA
jgi:O-methyltransferase